MFVSPVQDSLILGTLLGDGAMRCKTNALLEINHSARQRSYVDWKYSLLRQFVSTPPSLRVTNGGRIAYRFTTRSVAELTPYFSLFYATGVKSVPQVRLTPLALAVWFMDDGRKTRRTVYLNTQQFALSDQHTLLGLLYEQFGLSATLNRDRGYYRIRVAGQSIDRFRQLVVPHVLPELSYKLP